jgi:signal transduction histidine kinase/CheY-like chemotaxis protein
VAAFANTTYQTMSLTEQEEASIADRRRVWESRKYCQLQPSITQYARYGTASTDSRPSHGEFRNTTEPDPALTALLRGVLNQLSTDLVMISLLDDHTQFFISGATNDDCDDAKITLASTQWYGCDEVVHHGGLCERTITVKETTNEPGAIYEVLDMSVDAGTQDLPFVNGTIASFRHYIGSPITTPTGYNIGTVFAMGKDPAPAPATPAQRHYLNESSGHIMGQLVQAMQALEGRRAATYNAAITSFLYGEAYKEIGQMQEYNSGTHPPEVSTTVYSIAAKLLHDCFGLDGLTFQDMPLSGRKSKASDSDLVLASSLQPGMSAMFPVALDRVNKLLSVFPQGGIIYADDRGSEKTFSGFASGGVSPLDLSTNAALGRSFPRATQIVFAPLWDAVHSRITAICFGWVNDNERVFESDIDLTAMSSFCMAAMSHILRMESQRLDQVKSDFLGSISHETRSPLHNVLGNLELLLATDCSTEQREMLVNARFGATQLLESIDKILEYSRVSGQSATASESHPVKEPQVLDQDADQDRGGMLQVGRRSGDAGTASGHTDLIDLCEEIVEDVSKRMRISDTMMSPGSRRRVTSGNAFDSPQKQGVNSEGDEVHERYFSIILFDARSMDNCQVSRNSGIRIILENLLVSIRTIHLAHKDQSLTLEQQSNAIRFTRVDCCVRCYLTLEPEHAEFAVIDCGRGFSQDFIRHSLYIPFSQQDPVDEGVGLGMSVIKRNVEELSGTISIDTEESLGSTAIVTVPLHRLIEGVEQRPENDLKGRGGTATIPPSPNIPEEELPTLRACVYAPSSWMRRFDERDKRSIELLHQSLGHTLGAWFRPVISIWQEADHEDDQELPDLVFVTQHDVEVFRQACGEKFKNVKTIVICADIGRYSESDGHKIEAAALIADAIIMGSIIPSKLWKTLALLFPHIIPANSNTLGRSIEDLSIQGQGDKEPVTGGACENSEARPVSTPGQTESHDYAESGPEDTGYPLAQENYHESQARLCEGSEDSNPPQHVPNEQAKAAPQPRVLLVDDNAVNLKVLSMFLEKGGIPQARQTSAAGGQEAIDTFKNAYTSNDMFDIIFMDLSMPKVSGFDATAAIRHMEDSAAGKRTYVVALTGLVSDKDRSAAATAGVDDYVTKPAGLKNVQAVIKTWETNWRP